MVNYVDTSPENKTRVRLIYTHILSISFGTKAKYLLDQDRGQAMADRVPVRPDRIKSQHPSITNESNDEWHEIKSWRSSARAAYGMLFFTSLFNAFAARVRYGIFPIHDGLINNEECPKMAAVTKKTRALMPFACFEELCDLFACVRYAHYILKTMCAPIGFYGFVFNNVL